LLLAPPGQAVRGALAPSQRPASSAPRPRPTAGFRLTGAGKTRQDLGGHGRTKDREAKQRGNKARDYKYDAKTNTATLKKKRALTSPCP